MNKPTPGPWKVEMFVDAIHVVASDGSMIADVSDRRLDSDGMPPANARLIAAAPNLLAACRALVAAIGDDDPSWRNESGLLAAKEAIAKAES